MLIRLKIIQNSFYTFFHEIPLGSITSKFFNYFLSKYNCTPQSYFFDYCYLLQIINGCHRHKLHWYSILSTLTSQFCTSRLKIHWQFSTPKIPVQITVQCESKKSPPPLRTCGNFSKTVGNFSTKFYMLLCVPIYARLWIFIHCNFDEVMPY